MPDEPVLPDEDLVTPEHLLHSPFSLHGMPDYVAGSDAWLARRRDRSDAELIGDAAQYAARLATLDENRLFGIVMLLFAAAGAVASVLVARRALQAIRGEDHPLRDGDYG